ncbi:MAG TPA: 2OG-Fe(II) oxygenase [Rhizomicrobium sp.]
MAGRFYFRAAMPQNDDSTLSFAVWPDAFSPAELDAIAALGDGLAAGEAMLVNGTAQGEQRPDTRITRTAWITRTPDSAWIYDRMQQVVGALNDQVYQFDLRGFAENFQYTIYHGAAGGHYDWHVDQGQLPVQRKLSLSLQLSDPADYDGCVLQFYAGASIQTAPRSRGSVIAFPSYVLHRVTPCTRGTRKAVVVWSTGPKFR